MSDIEQPAHYLVGGIEAIDVIEAKLTPEQFRGYLLGSSLKYQLRANHKNASRRTVRRRCIFARNSLSWKNLHHILAGDAPHDLCYRIR